MLMNTYTHALYFNYMFTIPEKPVLFSRYFRRDPFHRNYHSDRKRESAIDYEQISELNLMQIYTQFQQNSLESIFYFCLLHDFTLGVPFCFSDSGVFF